MVMTCTFGFTAEHYCPAIHWIVYHIFAFLNPCIILCGISVSFFHIVHPISQVVFSDLGNEKSVPRIKGCWAWQWEVIHEIEGVLSFLSRAIFCVENVGWGPKSSNKEGMEERYIMNKTEIGRKEKETVLLIFSSSLPELNFFSNQKFKSSVRGATEGFIPSRALFP